GHEVAVAGSEDDAADQRSPRLLTGVRDQVEHRVVAQFGQLNIKPVLQEKGPAAELEPAGAVACLDQPLRGPEHQRETCNPARLGEGSVMDVVMAEVLIPAPRDL